MEFVRAVVAHPVLWLCTVYLVCSATMNCVKNICMAYAIKHTGCNCSVCLRRKLAEAEAAEAAAEAAKVCKLDKLAGLCHYNQVTHRAG